MRRLVVLAVATAALAAGDAAAVVPPTNCGTVKLGARSYAVKTHSVSCSFARTWTVRYIRYNRRPSGWTCRKYDPRETRIRFRCYRGSRDFFAIRK